ncbi:MAG: DUF4145 domain-containing protein [Desulfobacula sp.]|jgi:hypothetical protein|nr:DUF4145 domain-containing protein [Desulfobacula sp.]
MKIIAFIVSFIFLSLGVAHLFIDKFTVDTIALALLVLATLPWLFPYLKSLELPGGVKIELKDVREPLEKLSNESSNDGKNSPYENIDPKLALVALRIDIEKMIRSFQSELGELSNKSSSLSIRIQVLRNEGVLSPSVAEGLLEIIKLGNEAAHGATVDMDAAEFVIFKSGNIINKLEEQLKSV